ncbi:MAG: radical SAM protein [bacterium]|nr:radical SAM protein [bacterium]
MNQFLNASIEGVRRLLFLIPKHPEIAQIEITNRCNFNCLMCQRIDLKVPISDMDYNVYLKVMKKLDGIKEIILTGWGEPLMHPKLIEIIDVAKKNKKRVSLTSNGSLLTEKTAKKLLDSKIDSISFSLDDVNAPKTGSIGHPVTIQLKNIENFMKLIKGKKTRPQVVIQVTLHKNKEKQIFEVIKWAGRIEADLVNINRLDMRFNNKLSRPDYFEEKELVQKLERVSKECKIRVEFRSHVAFSGKLRQIYKILIPFLQRGGKHCLRVYNYIYINQRGEVTPCCALPLLSFGNLIGQNLDNIWKGQAFNNFRKHKFQRKICGKCDVLEIKQYC